MLKKLVQAEKPGDEFDREGQLARKELLNVQGITDEAHQAIITDEYAGQGGSFIFDPVTKLRSKVENEEFAEK